MGKEDVYRQEGILFSPKKEWNSAVCRKVNDPRKYPYSMKLNQTKTILYDITYMWNLNYDTNEVTYLQKRNKA